MVLHLCLFAAVLLLFSDLLGGNSKTQAVKVFLVELTEEVSSISEGRPDSTGALIQPLKVLKTKALRFKRPSPIKAEKFSAVDIPDKTVSVETDVTGGDIIDLNTHKETAEDPFLKNSSNEVIDVMSGSGTGINVYYSSFSHGSKGVMSAGIIEIIKNSIERAKTYPLLAKKRDIEGTVYISFRVSLRGELQELKILKSSGSSILDTATLDIVKKAAPFPYVDNRIEVPVVFRLN